MLSISIGAYKIFPVLCDKESVSRLNDKFPTFSKTKALFHVEWVYNLFLHIDVSFLIIA